MKPIARPKAQILTIGGEMKKTITAARRREKSATTIRHARYDRKRDVVIAEVSTGSTLTVPRRVVPGFARARSAALSDLEITSGREGLWSDNADDGTLLEQLIILAAGEAMIGTIGARINATKKPPARAAASRANGAKGGRPRKAAA